MARFTVQPAFTKGEVTPGLLGRIDTQLYQESLKTAKNVYIHATGGVSNRAGLMFIGPMKDHANPGRLIRFRFSTTDTHILEFGNLYFRVIRHDAYVTTAVVNVTSVSLGSLITIGTASAHGYSTGDEVIITGLGGTAELNNTHWKITVTDTTHFTLQDQVTGMDVDGTAFTAYTSGGSVGTILTVTTPYTSAELDEIRFDQTADILSLSHVNHSPQEIKRLALDNWTIGDIAFQPAQASPTNISSTVSGTTGSTTYRYKVTATSVTNGEESLPGLSTLATLSITGVSLANPVVITTSSAHSIPTGGEIELSGIGGTTELNGRRYRADSLTSTTFQLRDVDGTNLAPYTSGGTVTKAYTEVTNGNTAPKVDLSWSSTVNARQYSVYREVNGIYGLIGETEGLSFLDDNEPPDVTETPPQARNPFFGTGNYPTAIGSHQQRRVFGGSNNAPDTSFYGRIGVNTNFSNSIPLRVDDAITAVLPAADINQILHYSSSPGGLLILTAGSEWLVVGSSTQGFTPSTIQQELQSRWGSSSAFPLLMGVQTLFVLRNGTGVRALSFSIQIGGSLGGFTSANVSLHARHLFRNHTLVHWDAARQPEPLIYGYREDGVVLCLAFDFEQKVAAWSHWETGGKFKSVAVISPTATSTVDVPYFIVQRTIKGQTVQYVERLHERNFKTTEDAFFVDSGLSLDAPIPITGVSLTNPVVITAVGHGLSDGDEIAISDILWDPIVSTNGTETQPAQLNGNRYIIANSTTNTFELTSAETSANIDGTAFRAYVEGGNVRKAVGQVAGLWHLRGESVTILADGNVLPSQVVSDAGTLTLNRKYSRVHVGLAYTADIETLPLSLGPQAVVQGSVKKVNRVTLIMDRTRGLFVGSNDTNLVEMRQRENEPIGAPTTLFTGNKQIWLDPDWNPDGNLLIRQKDPLPVTLLAVVPEFEVGR